MKDLIPGWISDMEHFQEMPLELSAEIDLFLEGHTINGDVEDMREFLADRHEALQNRIDELRAASLSGSMVLLAEEDD